MELSVSSFFSFDVGLENDLKIPDSSCFAIADVLVGLSSDCCIALSDFSLEEDRFKDRRVFEFNSSAS